MFVIKNTQNTNHYLISRPGLRLLSVGFWSVTASVKIKWIASKFGSLDELVRWTSLMSLVLSWIKLVPLESLYASGDDQLTLLNVVI